LIEKTDTRNQNYLVYEVNFNQAQEKVH